MIIDLHTHTFPEKISARVIDGMARVSHAKPYTDASRAQLLASMARAGIDWSVNLPVVTRPDHVVKINRSLTDCHAEMIGKHLLTFGGMHPDFENYKAELRWIREQGLPGIKLHPTYQNARLDDPRMMRLIDAASEESLAVIVHAGIDISKLNENLATIPMILKIIETIHPEKLILAHMGNWGCWDEVERELAGAPVWFDTAFSVGPILPYPGIPDPPLRDYMLTDDQFVRLCRRHGTKRILFGSDCPWSDQTAFVKRLASLPFTEEEYNDIMWRNAVPLLSTPELTAEAAAFEAAPDN